MEKLCRYDMEKLCHIRENVILNEKIRIYLFESKRLINVYIRYGAWFEKHMNLTITTCVE